MEEKHQFYKELSKTIKDGAGLQVSIEDYVMRVVTIYILVTA